MSIILSGYLAYKIVRLADRAQDRLSEALLEASRLIHAKTLHEYAQAREIAAESDLRVRSLEDALDHETKQSEGPIEPPPHNYTLADGRSIDLNQFTFMG